MAYNLSSEGAEQNRNGGYTFPPAYAASPVATAPAPASAQGWKEYAKLYQYDPMEGDPGSGMGSRGVGAVNREDDAERMREKILAASIKRPEGITQPEFEWMKRTGNAYLLTPDHLKEASKQWFNKPYNNDAPESIEFRKVLLDNDSSPFRGGISLYDMGKYEEEWGKLHSNELTDEDKAFARKEKIDFTTPRGVYQLFQRKNKTAPTPTGTEAVPAAAASVGASVASIAPAPVDTALAGPPVDTSRYSSGGPGQTRQEERKADRAALANWNADHSNWTAAGAIAAKNATNTFLPPYLQPGAGAGTAGAPGLPAIVPAPTPMPAPLTPLGSPITPFVPQGITPAGSPLTPFVPQAALPGASMTGGFAKTAKLLELPFYLRQFGGNYGRS